MVVLFDVDGTLTRTSGLDAEVYARTFRAVFGAALPTLDWSGYRHATDRGIAEEAIGRLGLDADRIDELRRRFADELGTELARTGALPVGGAAGILGAVEANGHVAALATGAWEAPARAKLAAAGVDVAARVLVGSDHHPAREEIIREAWRRTGAAARAVYVGDGLWDLHAARALGIPFVGVDPERTGVLVAAGVRSVVAGYADPDAFLRTLREAAVP